MMPCCDLCYEEYLREDGSVDEEALARARDKRRKRQLDQGRVPTEESGEPSCRCECHVIGRCVLH